VLNTYMCYFSNPNYGKSEDAVYLIESVVQGHHICKRVQSRTICKLTQEDRNDDRLAVCLQV